MKKIKFKRNLVIGALIYGLLLYLIISNTFSVNAEAFSKTFTGIEYRNSDNSEVSKELILEGLFSNPLIGKSRFQGILIYDDKSYEMDFKIEDGEDILILDQGNFTGANTTLGLMYTDEQMSQVTLQIFEYDDESIKSWRQSDGLIFSGDAGTREEAEGIYQEYSGSNGL